jgi:hypothetical protein
MRRIVLAASATLVGLLLVACSPVGAGAGDGDGSGQATINANAVASVSDGVGGFTAIGDALDVTTVTMGSSVYALTASLTGIQIIDITNPASPQPVAAITDKMAGFGSIDGADSITTATIGSTVYALVDGWSSLTIIDISNPSSPQHVETVIDGIDGFDTLDGAIDVTTVNVDGSVYALVAAFGDGGIQIIDITNPASPVATAEITGVNGPQHVTGVTIGSKPYAAVVGFTGNFLRLYDISNPASPSVADNISARFRPGGVATISVGSSIYALVATQGYNGVDVFELTAPTDLKKTTQVTNGEGGFDMLQGAYGLATATIDGVTYALVTSLAGNGVQFIDITDPANPQPAGSISDGIGGFDALEMATSITTVKIGASVYALVASQDDGVQIMRL